MRSDRASSSPRRPGWRSVPSCSCSRGSSGPAGECCTSSRSCSPPRRRRSCGPRRCTTPRPLRSRWRRVASSSRCAACRHDSTLRTGAGAGALLGLAALTRVWALPVLVAVLVAWSWTRGAGRAGRRRRRSSRRPLALLGPWLLNRGGRPRQRPRLQPPRPARLDAHAPARELLPRPAGAPGLRPSRHAALPERAPTASYADWWGDWALTWDTLPPPAPAELLPPSVVAEPRAADVRRHRPVGPGARRDPRARPACEGAAFRLRSPCCR